MILLGAWLKYENESTDILYQKWNKKLLGIKLC